jgi:hypothetical protein
MWTPLTHVNLVAHTTHGATESSNATTRKDTDLPVLPETDKMIRRIAGSGSTTNHGKVLPVGSTSYGFQLPVPPCLPAYYN